VILISALIFVVLASSTTDRISPFSHRLLLTVSSEVLLLFLIHVSSKGNAFAELWRSPSPGALRRTSSLAYVCSEIAWL
jgi:hypothetical protein